MSRSFSSIGAFTAYMRGRLATLPAAEKRALGDGIELIRDAAREQPGTYQPGWPKLKPATVARKATGDSPLRETGAMAQGYESKVVGPKEAVAGSNDDKAIWQELGTSRGIPPRNNLQAAGIKKGPEAARRIGAAVIAHLAGRTNH
ncbi:hypothetical protein ACLBYG_22415 [Methylobacterium sp. D53M]